jgi:tRNA modification GTPase
MSDLPPLYVIQLTPPGRGAVATLRIEGPGAVEAVQSRFRARNAQPLTSFPVDRLVVGHFGDDRGEEVVVCRHADSAVELHCHGGFAAAALIEQSLVAAGCRRLGWREWIAGQTDRITADAWAALAEARTERTAAVLLDQYHGALRRALDEIQQAIDRGDINVAQRQIDTLRSRTKLGQHLTQPWRVVLAGRVNVGKSSLINALAGYGRAIVHSTPGTTRDAVTMTTAIDGWPVELCDTAGLRAGGNDIERAGIELAHQRLAHADLVILITDGSTPWSVEDQSLLDQWPGALLVHNKCDLPRAPGDRPTGIWISALREDGIKSLLDAIAARLVPDPPPAGTAVPFTAEQIAMVNAFGLAG